MKISKILIDFFPYTCLAIWIIFCIFIFVQCCNLFYNWKLTFKHIIPWVMYNKEFSSITEPTYIVQRPPGIFEFKRDYLKTYYHFSGCFTVMLYSNNVYYIYTPLSLWKGTLMVFDTKRNNYERYQVQNLNDLHWFINFKLIPGSILTISPSY